MGWPLHPGGSGNSILPEYRVTQRNQILHTKLIGKCGPGRRRRCESFATVKLGGYQMLP
jgi:hypothetical protein